jgi:hypothetical protein
LLLCFERWCPTGAVANKSTAVRSVVLTSARRGAKSRPAPVGGRLVSIRQLPYVSFPCRDDEQPVTVQASRRAVKSVIRSPVGACRSAQLPFPGGMPDV